MKISQKDWQNYIARLRKINDKAAEKVASFIETHDCSTPEGMKLLIDYSHAVATKYGEGAAELSCQMLDAVAEASGVYVPAAEPAATATYGEIAKTIYGTMASTKDPKTIGAAVGRSVKLASVDTLQQNALRDGAEWAWIPQGDTCPFCIMLASNGWQRASKKAIKNGHATHIHNNCDCTYCVRYDGETTVEGYGNGEEYRDIYKKQKGIDPAILKEVVRDGYDLNTPKGRMIAMSRAHRAVNKDYINAQKRAAYARGKDKPLRITAIAASTITKKVESGEYSLKLSKQQYDKHLAGTKDYKRYEASRASKGLGPQSRLIISYEEALKIIEKQSGTGIIKVRKDGTPLDIEWITCDKVIGQYCQKGQWVDTNKAEIRHGRKGSHLVPCKGNNYD